MFKPSELTPGVGELYARCWQEAGLPAGVFNMLQGGREPGAALAVHPDIDGLFFTGSSPRASRCTKRSPHMPEKLLALEMGGNNPLIAARRQPTSTPPPTIAQSAFLTAGQRCTCARRLDSCSMMQRAMRLLERIAELAATFPRRPLPAMPEPFMGPVISDARGRHDPRGAGRMLAKCARRGPLRRSDPLGRAASYALARHSRRHRRRRPRRRGIFGPLLQVIRVPDFDAALAEANNTRFGLAAALLSDDRALYERFFGSIRAGVVNWNRPTTGAATACPSAASAQAATTAPPASSPSTYSNDPIASLESPTLEVPRTLPPGISL